MGFETILPMVTSVISGMAKGGGGSGGSGQQAAPLPPVPMNPQGGVQNPAIMQAAQQSSPSMLQAPQQMLPLTPNDPSMLTGGLDNPDYWTKLLGGQNGLR
jgi:hypothetical protein